MAARIETTPKLKIETNGRYEMETMHLMDTEADEEKALRGANVPVHDLTGVDDYLERRKDGLPVGTVCEPCKAPAVRWVESHCLKLEADAGDLRASADRLERMSTNSLANARSRRRRRAEKAEREEARHQSSAERRNMEAAQLEGEADEYRRVANILARETGLEGQQG